MAAQRDALAGIWAVRTVEGEDERIALRVRALVGGMARDLLDALYPGALGDGVRVGSAGADAQNRETM